MRTMFYTTVALAALMAGGAQAQLVIEKGSDDRINWKSLEDFGAAHADISGQSVTILAPWLGADQALFTSIMSYFEDATGATVNYSGSNSFEQQIVIDSEAGSTVMPPLAPPYGNPASAHFQLIHTASAATSPISTLLENRVPPLVGPSERWCCTR